MIQINNTRTIKDLQKDFNQKFSFLKIEFFNQPHEAGSASEDGNILENHLLLSEIRTVQKNGKLELDKKMTVGNFEKLFSKEFGLNIQVYRKSHGKWLQTWVTDIWTLEEQNERGKILGDIDDLLIQ